MSNNTPARKPRSKDGPWGQIFAGGFIILAALYLHKLFNDLETGAIQSTRLNSIVVLMYKILGHMPTVLIIGGLGVLMIVLGLRQLIMRWRKRRNLEPSG